MLYEVLWLTPSSTIDDIKVHYKMLAKAVHPDRHEDQTEKANLAFREVEDAYLILSNPVTRAIYDTYGKEGLNLYENHKGYFEDIEKDDESARPKALARYRAVKIMNDNTKAIDQIDRQSLKINSTMIYYFMLNARAWAYPKPFLRFSNLRYNASVKYHKNKSINVAIDGKDGFYYPTIHHSVFQPFRVMGYPIDLVLTNELTNPSNFILEISKQNYEKL